MVRLLVFFKVESIEIPESTGAWGTLLDKNKL